MMRLNFATLSDPCKKPGDIGDNGDSQYSRGLIRPRLPGNAGDTRGQSPAPMIEGQDEKPELSPMSPNRLQPWGHGKPCIHALSPMSPMSPQKHMNKIDREAFEERAAIMEFDGGLSRAEAERLAAESLGVAA